MVDASERVKAAIRGLVRERGPQARVYDEHYYGILPPYTANYRQYGEPNWSKPLAEYIGATCLGPYVDVGGAFGYLMRDLKRYQDLHGVPGPAEDYLTFEWSSYAHERSVSPTAVQGDARELLVHLGEASVGTLISMDFLEHFTPGETEDLIVQMSHVVLSEGVSIHLIGWHDPEGDLDAHMSDPTHLNHEPISWYEAVFQRHHHTLLSTMTRELNQHPAWRDNDWNGRWLAFQRA